MIPKALCTTVVVLLVSGLLICSSAFGANNPAYGPKGYKGITWHKWANPYCESGGYPYIKTNPKYRGKWQFDQRTWNSFAPRRYVGRDPATVPEYWQDWTALRVTYDAWPNC